ncbi:hypothetical protein U1Q18_030517 [Sarracenia purpurea var. burkii]
MPIQNCACPGRWIGYVAVSTDEEVQRLGRRDVLITFRGTITNLEWIANFMSALTPARLDPHHPRPDVKVEARGEEMSITLAGHSMESSLALLLAYDIAELGLTRGYANQDITVTVFSFAGPRVRNPGFKERCEEMGVKVLRIVNVNDPITKLPRLVFNENFRVLHGRYEFPWRKSCYAHVAQMPQGAINLKRRYKSYQQSKRVAHECPKLRRFAMENAACGSLAGDLIAISRVLLLIADHAAAFKPFFIKPLQSLQPFALFFILCSAADFLPMLVLFWPVRRLVWF